MSEKSEKNEVEVIQVATATENAFSVDGKNMNLFEIIAFLVNKVIKIEKSVA